MNGHLSDSEDEYDQLVHKKIKSTSILQTSTMARSFTIDVAATSAGEVPTNEVAEKVVEETAEAAVELPAPVKVTEVSPNESSLRSDKEIVPPEFVKESEAVSDGDQIDESIGGTVTKSIETETVSTTDNASNEPNVIQPIASEIPTAPPLSPKLSASSVCVSDIITPTNVKVARRDAFISRSGNVSKSMDDVGTPKRTKVIAKQLAPGNGIDMPSAMKRFLKKPKTKPLIGVDIIVKKSPQMNSLASSFDVSGNNQCSTPISMSLVEVQATALSTGSVAVPVATTSSGCIHSRPKSTAKPEAEAIHPEETLADSGCIQSFTGVSTGPGTTCNESMSTAMDGKLN